MPMTATTGLVPPNLGLVVKELVQILQQEKWPHFKEDAFRKCWFLAVEALHNEAIENKTLNPIFWIESSNLEVPAKHPAATDVTLAGFHHRSAVKLPKGDKPLLRLAVQVNGAKKKKKTKKTRKTKTDRFNSDVRIGAAHGERRTEISTRKDGTTYTRKNAVEAAEVLRHDYLIGEVKAGMFGSTSDTNLRGGEATGFRADIDQVAKGQADFCSLLMDLDTADFLAETRSGGKKATPLGKLFNIKRREKGREDRSGRKGVNWQGSRLQKWCFRVKPKHAAKDDEPLLLWVICKHRHKFYKAWGEALKAVAEQSGAPTSSDVPAPTR